MLENEIPRKLTRREREKAFRKQAILDVAQEIFAREGYANAGMAQIAQEAELSVGALYQSFPNKATLFAEVVLRQLEAGRKQVAELTSKQATWPEQLHAFLDFYMGWTVGSNSDFIRTVIELYYSSDPDIAPGVMERFRNLEQYAMDVVKEILLKSNQLSQGVDPDLAATVLVGALNAIYRSCSIGLLPRKPAEYIDDINKLIFKIGN
ncbi:MAG: HTH-type transcriptional regulator LuxR [Deltaproteobacteria bacterium ADurb.Bin510]|nr:MAG: HTH-type transcriptional regulator LuxR [Deltaproteobacteria bacterium ADurb.Bin510]